MHCPEKREEERAENRRQAEADEVSPTERFITDAISKSAVITLIVGLVALAYWCGADNRAKCKSSPELCVDYPVDDDPRH